MAQPHRRRRAGLVATVAGLLAVTASVGATQSAAQAASSQAVDVLFVFDTTGSMGGALAEAKAQVKDAIASVRSSYPDSDFGLATVAYYDAGDTPWALKRPV